jgi:hypothetical protein
MEAQNDSLPSSERSSLRERIRKVLIVLLLLGALLPPLSVNVGQSAQTAGWSGPILKLNQPFPSFCALMLCQLWTLFSNISPNNYVIYYQVQLTNGQIVGLQDQPIAAAGKWQSVLFHNEPKMWLNLYNDRYALRQYMEYLIRTNGIYPEWVVRRTIWLRYHHVLHRDEAAKAGTLLGPEETSVFDDY